MLESVSLITPHCSLCLFVAETMHHTKFELMCVHNIELNIAHLPSFSQSAFIASVGAWVKNANGPASKLELLLISYVCVPLR